MHRSGKTNKIKPPKLHQFQGSGPHHERKSYSDTHIGHTQCRLWLVFRSDECRPSAVKFRIHKAHLTLSPGQLYYQVFSISILHNWVPPTSHYIIQTILNQICLGGTSFFVNYFNFIGIWTLFAPDLFTYSKCSWKDKYLCALQKL